MWLNKVEEKNMSGCAISAVFDKSKQKFSGNDIINSISLMHERSNGLGGGFAAYGIYPEHSHEYAFHLFYNNRESKNKVENFINRHFKISLMEKIPTREKGILTDIPVIWRYFVLPDEHKLLTSQLSQNEYVARCVMNINHNYEGAYVFSSGKNMGVFKGVGYPEDIADFYKLDEYQAYLWTAHGRFPTNTPGWWGGAHPFTLLDWSIVHNGEISSYGANKRYLEMFGYKCTMMTDTEVITYIFDLLLRKHKLPLPLVIKAVASPLWNDIDRMSEKEKKICKMIRMIYGNCLLNGPFSIILGFQDGFIALNDRIKLRSLTVAENKNKIYVASEESAIREICKNPEKIWYPGGGEAVVATVKGVEFNEL